MIGILPAHERMAEIHLISKKLGGFDKLSIELQQEFFHCVAINTNVVHKMIHLKQLSEVAYQMGDDDWNMDICKQIDELEAQMI